MGLIERANKQQAVYWPLGSADSGGVDYDNYGNIQHAAPIQIKCRWTDKNELFIGPNGEQRTSKAKVLVDRDVSVGGMLMLGVLADVIDLATHKENKEAWEIQAFHKIPDLRAKRFLRKVFL
jgi:hypothetical protein